MTVKELREALKTSIKFDLSYKDIIIKIFDELNIDYSILERRTNNEKK